MPFSSIIGTFFNENHWKSYLASYKTKQSKAKEKDEASGFTPVAFSLSHRRPISSFCFFLFCFYFFFWYFPPREIADKLTRGHPLIDGNDVWYQLRDGSFVFARLIVPEIIGVESKTRSAPRSFPSLSFSFCCCCCCCCCCYLLVTDDK